MVHDVVAIVEDATVIVEPGRAATLAIQPEDQLFAATETATGPNSVSARAKGSSLLLGSTRKPVLGSVLL